MSVYELMNDQMQYTFRFEIEFASYNWVDAKGYYSSALGALATTKCYLWVQSRQWANKDVLGRPFVIFIVQGLRHEVWLEKSLWPVEGRSFTL